MTITSLDTHDFVNRLTSSGITLQHAEAHTKALTVFMGNELVRRTDLSTFKIEMRSESTTFRSEVRSELHAFRLELNEFKTEVRSELNAFRLELKEFKTEMRSELNAFKSEIRSELQAFRLELKEFQTELDKKFCSIETRFIKIEGELRLGRWMTGFLLASQLAIMFKLFL